MTKICVDQSGLINVGAQILNIKGISISDLYIDLPLKLHLINNNFQISNLRFSLDSNARGDTYQSTKWKQEPVLHQAASLKVASIRQRKNVGKTTWTTHKYFIDFESQIYVKISLPN